MTSCQFGHASTASCLELTQPLDQGTPTPPVVVRDTTQSVVTSCKPTQEFKCSKMCCFNNVVIYVWVSKIDEAAKK